MTRRVVLIKHEDSPRDDRAAAWLAARGFALDWRHPFAGDDLGEPDGGVAGTVLYGGAPSVTEPDRYPFLVDEARWVERCVGRGIPTLGLCLGGQIIADALGRAGRSRPARLSRVRLLPAVPERGGAVDLPRGADRHPGALSRVRHSRRRLVVGQERASIPIRHFNTARGPSPSSSIRKSRFPPSGGGRMPTGRRGASQASSRATRRTRSPPHTTRPSTPGSAGSWRRCSHPPAAAERPPRDGAPRDGRR